MSSSGLTPNSPALALAEELVQRLTEKGKTIAGAESCTAGLAADMIACIPGASNVLWGCFVTYTFDAKHKMLGVSEELLKEHGAVSQPVALAMAEGALKKSGASWAFSITGYAGPGGSGDSEAPVGTVWIGIAERLSLGNEPTLRSEAKRFFFKGERNEVRQAAAATALEELLRHITTPISDSEIAALP